MSRFEYLSVLVSIVIALGINEVTISWGRLIQRRERVKFSWLHAFWSLFTLFLLIQLWWGFWNFRTVETWSLAALLAVVTEAITLVLCALLLVPGAREDAAACDLHRVYLDNSRPFFLLGALLLVQLTLVDVLVLGMPLLHGENAMRGVGTAVAIVAARSRHPRVHTGVALVSLALLAGFLLEALAL
jgi:hypothetical protein